MAIEVRYEGDDKELSTAIKHVAKLLELHGAKEEKSYVTQGRRSGIQIQAYGTDKEALDALKDAVNSNKITREQRSRGVSSEYKALEIPKTPENLRKIDALTEQITDEKLTKEIMSGAEKIRAAAAEQASPGDRMIATAQTLVELYDFPEQDLRVFAANEDEMTIQFTWSGEGLEKKTAKEALAQDLQTTGIRYRETYKKRERSGNDCSNINISVTEQNADKLAELTERKAKEAKKVAHLSKKIVAAVKDQLPSTQLAAIVSATKELDLAQWMLK